MHKIAHLMKPDLQRSLDKDSQVSVPGRKLVQSTCVETMSKWILNHGLRTALVPSSLLVVLTKEASKTLHFF